MSETNTLINETIKDIFMQNITSINSLNFNKQNYNTQVNKTPSPNILKRIDDIALQYLNNYIYSAAVPVNNQSLGQLIENNKGNKY